MHEILVFYKEKCGASRKLINTLKKVTDNVTYIDPDEYPQKAMDFNIMALPTTIVHREGVGTKTWVGFNADIYDRIEEFLLND